MVRITARLNTPWEQTTGRGVTRADVAGDSFDLATRQPARSSWCRRGCLNARICRDQYGVA